MERPLIRVIVAGCRLYKRWISPHFGGRCRFAPTCSEYAAEAFQTHGLFRGAGLATWRVCRCHPFGGFGYDPVPERKDSKRSSADACGFADAPVGRVEDTQSQIDTRFQKSRMNER
ncbi:MAG: membrane protein insertion efficiency factor YidD [Deltaproteobacteria bacterium]|nr:membrane protein insertion efficiency factor YidD [Deltaproteobacteria bacterium]